MNNVHNESTVYGWGNCPEPIKELVDNILKNYQKILGDNLIGFYLHGSLAMNCFSLLYSDVDFLSVVKKKLTIGQKKAIIVYLLQQYNNSPPKGIEMSIILEEYLRNFVYPTPFELHYSNDWYDKYRNGEVDYSKQSFDEDLAAHFVITRNRGICLFGRPIKEVFPEIPREIYAQSLLNDARWIYERSEKDPVHTILNLCRVLAFFKDNRITSKKEGGEWALLNLPKKYLPLINRALAAYAGGREKQLDINTLRSFVEYVKARLSFLANTVI
jgi:streptomycin 3"-adenylyltransferase